MRFENAQSGVNKIFVAKVLELIGSVLLIIGAFLGVAAVASVDAGASDAATGGIAAIALLSILPGAIMPVVAMVLELVGLFQASKDEPNFMKKAFWISIASLAISCMTGTIQSMSGNGLFISLLSTLQDVMAIVVFVFTIMGISVLVDQVNRPDVAAKGTRVLYIVTGVYVAALLASLLSNVVGAVFGVISLLFLIVGYVLYLSFLVQARSALRGQ